MAAIVETKGVKMHFSVGKHRLHAVDGIDLKIEAGKTLGVVGESGCGKSTLGNTILKLYQPTAGSIHFQGKDITAHNKRAMKPIRHDMQMVFQDPYSSLNPRMSVKQLITEPIVVNRLYGSKAEVEARVLELMDTVGLARRLTGAYIHELDGGRRQRIGVARALALNPKFIVCDEPVSALDVSIQAQIINLLMDLQDRFGLTYLFITHDLSVVKHISDEIMVMYLGKCVELASADELFQSPLHPYTQALLSAIPVADLSRRGRKRLLIKGEITSPIDPAPGCRFAPRCPLAKPQCAEGDVALRPVSGGHSVACIAVQ